jgi:hypothetical protein
MTVGLFVAAATPVLAHNGTPRTTWPTPHTGWRQASCIHLGSRFCSAKPRQRCASAHPLARAVAILPVDGPARPPGRTQMTAEETLQPAPSFKRAALGFLTSTACLCLGMLALSSF